jgi:hypothetical protein
VGLVEPEPCQTRHCIYVRNVELHFWIKGRDSATSYKKKMPHIKSNSIRWSKFHPLYEVIGGGIKIFSSLKHNLLQQFPYFPSQLVGLTMPHHLLLYKVSGSHW